MFYDLGSGSGRMVAAAALLHPGLRRCAGIEIIGALHRVAEAVRGKMEQVRPQHRIHHQYGKSAPLPVPPKPPWCLSYSPFPPPPPPLTGDPHRIICGCPSVRLRGTMAVIAGRQRGESISAMGTSWRQGLMPCRTSSPFNSFLRMPTRNLAGSPMMTPTR